jgi:general secretion pathway protein F
MPTFQYRAYGARGELAEGAVEAASETAASDELWSQGLSPFQIRQASTSGEPWWQRDLFGGKSARAADLPAFTRELATLVTAEIPIDDTLRIASDQASSARMRGVAASMLADVLNGATLSDAMGKQAGLFPGEYLSVVRAGEIGGTVGQVLEDLAALLERRAEVRAKIQSSLIYPAVLITLAMLSLGVIVSALVPSIAPIFAGSGKPMPAGLKFLVDLQASSFAILSGLVISVSTLAAAYVVAVRRPDIRLSVDRLKLKIPVVGSLVMLQEAARLARTLGTLLKAGVPLIQAATSARDVVANRHIATGMDRAIEAIREGVTLFRALQIQSILPASALQMISIGEEAGKLDQMLIRVATAFEQNLQRSIDRFMTILTPLLTMVIAALVGSLIMTVMNAVLSINDLAAQ